MKLLKDIRTIIFVCIGLCIAFSTYAQDNSLIGAGSTFVNPLFSKIFSVYESKNHVKVNYQAIGSGGGILQLNNKTVDFGVSDAPLNKEQTKKMGAQVLQIPMASGAVVISYNLPGLKTKLKLSGKTLGDIFLGKITNWNDPNIAASNKGVKLPNQPIAVIHRSDGSGTTYIFTDYLTKVNSTWAKNVGKASAVYWPAGLGEKGNSGVLSFVKQTPGAIGYVELAFAIQNKMLFADIQNKSGLYIPANLASTTLSSDITNLPADAVVSITNTDNPNGYPIASFTWALIYKDQKYSKQRITKATNLLKLLWYNIHEGQAYCAPLNYAPLSNSALKIAEKILKSATYGGKTILK